MLLIKYVSCAVSRVRYYSAVEFDLFTAAEDDVMHVISDVIIGVAGGLLTMALCVVAVVIMRSLYLARRKRLLDRHTQGAYAVKKGKGTYSSLWINP